MYGDYSGLYSRWCDCYDHGGVELQTIGKYVSIYGKDIIDIGCGTGRFLYRVLPYVKSAIGIDNDEQSLQELNCILSERFSQFISKTKIVYSSIEDAQITAESLDAAFFTWSLYALDKEQMRQALKKVYDMLRPEGSLIILQPTGGEFESVMRWFFEEHEEKDEYRSCIENMNELIPPLFEIVAEDTIDTSFTFSDLGEFCEALKMFAVTEGGCNSNELEHITKERLFEPMRAYIREDSYVLQDTVSLFAYKKRRAKP